jgi:multicomponent Na+:H+ antiporter subunit D
VIGILEVLLPLFVGAPLLLGGVLFVVPRLHPLQPIIGMGSLLAVLAGAITVLIATSNGTVVAHQVALWPEGIAIPFVADAFSALILTVAALVAVISFQYMLASGESRSPSIPALVLILMGGIAGALLTADLFNLFVFIEVMLLPSYGLLIFLSRRGDLGASRLYVVVNLLASTLFLAGVGLIYAVQGTVNLAALAGAGDDPATAIAVAVCLAAIAVKAAVFPVHGWLTRAYASASPAVAALFSALHTKVAVYVIYRISAVVFEGESTWMAAILVVASLTVVVGAFAALGEKDMRSLLLFQIVTGIGFVLVGVALFTPLSLTAGIVYMVHSMVVMGSLLLVASAIEHTYGSSRLDRVAGLRTREHLVTGVFVIGALSLVGLPPFSGFVAKYALVLATADAGVAVVGGLLIVVSLFVLMAMMKIWAEMFNGKRHPDVELVAAEARIRTRQGLYDGDYVDNEEIAQEAAHAVEHIGPPRGTTQTAHADPHEHRGTRVRLSLILPGLILAGVSVGLGFGGEFLVQLAEQASMGLIDTSDYVRAVIGR